MNLKERAAAPGIWYPMARRWDAAGTRPVAACRVGWLVVIGDPAAPVRAWLAFPVLAARGGVSVQSQLRAAAA